MELKEAVISAFSSVTGTFALEKVASTKLLTGLQSISNTMERKYFTTSLSQETRQVAGSNVNLSRNRGKTQMVSARH